MSSRGLVRFRAVFSRRLSAGWQAVHRLAAIMHALPRSPSLTGNSSAGDAVTPQPVLRPQPGPSRSTPGSTGPSSTLPPGLLGRPASLSTSRAPGGRAPTVTASQAGPNARQRLAQQLLRNHIDANDGRAIRDLRGAYPEMDINAHGDDRTPVQRAAAEGKLDALQALLDLGADVTKLSKSGKTIEECIDKPLSLATRWFGTSESRLEVSRRVQTARLRMDPAVGEGMDLATGRPLAEQVRAAELARIEAAEALVRPEDVRYGEPDVPPDIDTPSAWQAAPGTVGGAPRLIHPRRAELFERAASGLEDEPPPPYVESEEPPARATDAP